MVLAFVSDAYINQQPEDRLDLRRQSIDLLRQTERFKSCTDMKRPVSYAE